MTRYDHPNPLLNRMMQITVLVLLILLLLAIPALILLGLLLSAGGFYLMAVMVGLLTLPLWMTLSVTPAISLDQDGITIYPLLWKARFIPWENVESMADYPLLPTRDHEVERRVLQGRKKYRAAEGKMLRVRGLPPQYRATGVFVGEGMRPIIAVTNRTHTDYQTLIAQIEHFCPRLREEDESSQ